MRALITAAEGVALVERSMPTPGPGEVVVEVAYAGVCRTDLAVVDGAIEVPRGRVVGHELAGTVVDAGAVGADENAVDVGDAVTVIPFAACGACVTCDAGLRCGGPRWLGIDRDGAFAERVCVPRSSLVRLPAGMSLVLGAYVEPVAAALGAVSSIARGARVLVEGGGRIAELCARVLAAHGAEVARSSVDMPTSRAARAFDVVVETSGCEVAPLLALLRPGGTLILKSRARRRSPVPTDMVVARDLTIRGAAHGSFEAAVDWLHAKRISVDDLLAPPQPLEAFAEVLAAARTSEAKKQMFAISRSRNAPVHGEAR